MKLILINDRENNFLPVLSLNFGHFTIQWDCNPNQSCLWTDLNMSSNFFNVNVGVWEPFIEPLPASLLYFIKDDKQYIHIKLLSMEESYNGIDNLFRMLVTIM